MCISHPQTIFPSLSIKMATQCSSCNADALGFCLCDRTTAPVCASCYSEHSQAAGSTVHILLPLDLDPSILLSNRVGDYIERNRKAKILSDNMEKHVNTLNLQLERHLQDLSRSEEEIHTAVREKIQALKDQATELNHVEVMNVRQLMKEINQEAGKIQENAVTLAGEIILKCGNLDLFMGLQSSELRINTTPVVESINALKGVTLHSLAAQLTDRISLSSLYYFQQSTRTMTAFDPLRNIATVRDIPTLQPFVEGASVCQFAEGQLMISGGTWTNNAGVIDVQSKNYTGIRAMNSVRTYHGTIKYRNNAVYAFGGAHQSGVHTTFETYSLENTTWKQGNMHRNMKDVRTVCFQDKIFLTEYSSNVVDCFFPETSAFKALSFALPTGSAYSVLICEEDNLVVLKGNNVVTCKVQAEEKLLEVSRAVCDEATWQVWQSPVRIGDAYYFFNYTGRRIYSVQVTSQGAIVKTTVNYQVIKT